MDLDKIPDDIPDDIIIKEYKKRFYIKSGTVIKSPVSAYNHLLSFYGKNKIELFVVIYLSSSNKIIDTEIISKGTINSAYVYARELLKRILELNATSIIISHNHPSGDTNPSEEDIRLTKKLKELLKLMDVPLLDHIILANGKYISLSDKGII